MADPDTNSPRGADAEQCALPTTPAQYMSYVPGPRRYCEAFTKAGRPCRRRSSVRYEWPDESLYFCGLHGRPFEPQAMPVAAPTLGEQLDAIGKRLDLTTQTWAEAGYPSDGPLVDAREAVFADLRAWNARAAQ